MTTETDDPTLVDVDPTRPNPEQLDRWTKAMDDTDRLGPAINHHGGYEDRLANASLEAGYTRDGIGPQQVLSEQDAIATPKVGDRWSDLTALIPEVDRCRRTWNPDPTGPEPFACTRRAHEPGSKDHVAARGGQVVAVWNADGGRYENVAGVQVDTSYVRAYDPADDVAPPLRPRPGTEWHGDGRGDVHPSLLCQARWMVEGTPMGFTCWRERHPGEPHVSLFNSDQPRISAVWDEEYGEYLESSSWEPDRAARVDFPPAEEEVTEVAIPTLLADRLLEGTLVADLAVDTSQVLSVTVNRRQPAATAAFLAHTLAEQLSVLAASAALIQAGAVVVNPDGSAYRLTEDGTWAALRPDTEGTPS